MERKDKSLESRYGACKGAPGFLLQPLKSEGWQYPQWSIRFLTGEMPRGEPLNRIAKIALERLLDGRWHQIFPPEVGLGTVEALVDLGLIELKLTPIKNDPDSRRGNYRITQVGREALKRNCLLSERVN